MVLAGRLEEAKDVFERFIATSPDLVDYQYIMMMGGYMSVIRHLGDHARAAALATEVEGMIRDLVDRGRPDGAAQLWFTFDVGAGRYERAAARPHEPFALNQYMARQIEYFNWWAGVRDTGAGRQYLARMEAEREAQLSRLRAEGIAWLFSPEKWEPSAALQNASE